MATKPADNAATPDLDSFSCFWEIELNRAGIAHERGWMLRSGVPLLAVAMLAAVPLAALLAPDAGGLPGAPPMLALTTFDDEETVAAALGAGAGGFVLKDAPGEDIVRATIAVAGGNSWLDPQIAGQVLDAYRRNAGSQQHDRALIAQLTERERDVLRHVGRGETNAEIAAALFVSEATVKTHLGNLLGKLELRDRAAAIVFAHVNGLV